MCVPEKMLMDDELPQRILQNADEYRKNQKFCDFKVIANGFEIPVHRLVLASCSSYFNVLFSVNFKENADGFVELDQFPTDIIILLIEYIYTGKLQVSEKSIKQIFEASKYLGLEKLANFCSDILMDSISIRNALDMWRYGENFSHEWLLKKVKAFIAKNAAPVLNMHCKTFSYDEILVLISNDELNISEEDLFTCVIKWINADIKNRSQYLLRLIEYIRIPIMNSDFINKNILDNELFLAEPACIRYIIKALKNVVGENFTPAELILAPRTRYRNGFSTKEILLYNNDSGTLSRYDHLRNACTPVIPKIIKKAENGFACTNYKNNFFLAGGKGNTCIYYNPVYNTWQDFYPMKRSRTFHRLICANESLYACGGEESNMVEIFHNGGQSWINGPPMVKPHANFGLVTIDNSIYAVGGSISKNIERLDPRVGTWSHLSDLPEAVCESVAIDKCIYGFYGNGAGLFDLRNNKWEPISIPYRNGSTVKSVIEMDGNIFGFIYYPVRDPYSHHYEEKDIHKYNITTKSWTKLSNVFGEWGTCLGSVVLSWQK